MSGKISVSQPAGTPVADAAQHFADLLSQYTGGRVTLKVYPHDELGSETAIVQGCEQGTISFCQAQSLSSVVPSIQAPQGPYLYTSIDEEQTVLNDPKLTAIWQPEFSAKGLDYLGQWALPPSVIMTVSKAVKEPSDLKGLRVRVPNAYLGGLMFSPIGADPVHIAGNDVITAISTHAIDAIDDPLPTFFSEGWASGMHYVSLTYDWYGADAVVGSAAFMNKLSASEQSMVAKAFKATLATNAQAENAQLQQALAKVKSSSSLQVVPADIAAFKSAFAGVSTALSKKYPDIMPTLLQVASQASSASPSASQ